MPLDLRLLMRALLFGFMARGGTRTDGVHDHHSRLAFLPLPHRGSYCMREGLRAFTA